MELNHTMHTRLGHFPIGFRRGWGSWQHSSVAELAAWAASVSFGFLDLMNVTESEIQSVESHGVKLGTIDLLHFGKLLSADNEVRNSTLQANLDWIPKLASAGIHKFFTCLIGDSSRSRIDNFQLAVDIMKELCRAAARVNATIAFEGFPGQAPSFQGIGCNPETTRALLKEIPEGLGLNYDPSHLIRMGIDPIRFLQEFVPHVVHVHAKDTELSQDGAYEFGLYQDSVFAPMPMSQRYSGKTWRYRLPGRGSADWKQILNLLADNRYSGGISIELEDEEFLGTELLEKEALILARDFIANVH